MTNTGKETTLALAAAHALVLLEDGTVVGDPMEKTTLAALEWQLSKGDLISPLSKDSGHKYKIHIKRRYQFSSALKRMSTLSAVEDAQGRRWVAAVKGAPETLKTMYNSVPSWYDETYRYYTRRGSRVLALGVKTMSVEGSKVGRDGLLVNRRWGERLNTQVNTIPRADVECGLTFAGFLVFHCPLKPDAVEVLKMLASTLR